MIEEFVQLKSEPGDKRIRVMQTKRPFIVCDLYAWDKHNTDKIEEYMSALANGNELGCRVPGYSMFMIYQDNLMHREADPVLVREVSKRMAEWVVDTIVAYKPSRYARAKED